MPGLKPDFIKLDVEGFELPALRGMTRAVEANRPRLAVALYHKPEDLWEIPAWVGERYQRLHLRQHGGYGVETVLYALP